jgi:hypothetical protein
VTLRGEGVGSGEVIADRGYTQGAGGDWHLPLSSVGYDLSMDLKSDQRGERPGFGDARVIDGTPFSKHLPADLVDIRLPSQRDSAEVKAALTRKFDERGRFRYRRHKPPGSDGTTRWKCPFEAGAVRSRDLPWTMRSARTGPLVDVPDGACCRGIETAGAGTLPLYQRTLFGTTAWWKAYKARRQIIESINAELHGQFIDIGHGFVRTLRSNRIDLLLTVSLAGFNWYETRRWELQNHRPGHRGAPSSGPRKPRRDRLPRYEDILGQDPAT